MTEDTVQVAQKVLTTTDILALVGAITGTIGTVLALVAIVWDYYKWRYNEIVQLSVAALPNFVTTFNPEQNYIRVMVTNIGKIPTTIKLISLHGFNSKKEMRQKNGHDVALITPAMGELPVKLNPADDWDGFLIQNFEGVEKYLKYKYFCVQIEDTMSTKRFRAEVDKSKLR